MMFWAIFWDGTAVGLACDGLRLGVRSLAIFSEFSSSIVSDDITLLSWLEV